MPATTSPNISESLWTLAMKLINRMGFNTTSHVVRCGLNPCRAASVLIFS